MNRHGVAQLQPPGRWGTPVLGVAGHGAHGAVALGHPTGLWAGLVTERQLPTAYWEHPLPRGSPLLTPRRKGAAHRDDVTLSRGSARGGAVPAAPRRPRAGRAGHGPARPPRSRRHAQTGRPQTPQVPCRRRLLRAR